MAMMERNETIVAVDRGEPDEYRWYVRMRGEEKEFTTVWFTLGQRTLQFETYVTVSYTHLTLPTKRIV